MFIFKWLCDNILRMTRFLITRDYQEIDIIDFLIRSMTMNSRQTHWFLYDEMKRLYILTMTVFIFLSFWGISFVCCILDVLSIPNRYASDKKDEWIITYSFILSYKNVWREYKSELYLFSKFGIPIHLWQCWIMPAYDQQMLHKCLSIEVSNKDTCC